VGKLLVWAQGLGADIRPYAPLARFDRQPALQKLKTIFETFKADATHNGLALSFSQPRLQGSFGSGSGLSMLNRVADPQVTDTAQARDILAQLTQQAKQAFGAQVRLSLMTYTKGQRAKKEVWAAAIRMHNPNETAGNDSKHTLVLDRKLNPIGHIGNPNYADAMSI
jgi:hypothetical protein